MEHIEAVEMMASEKYLLDELEPELRDAYEEHFFGCAECALDVQTGEAFINQSKRILPQMKATTAKPPRGKRNWLAWLAPVLSPIVMVPTLACLMAFLGYQNLVVYPALELAANDPRVLPSSTVLHDTTRGGNPIVHADLVLGSTIAVEMPTGVAYEAYKFDFFNSKGKAIWRHTSHGPVSSDDTMSIWLPGSVKQDTYKLVVSGVTSNGDVIPVKQQLFDLQVKK